MDRLSRPPLPQLATLTVADLPRLVAERDAARDELDRATTITDTVRLHDKICWLTEQIVYLKARQRDKDGDQ